MFRWPRNGFVNQGPGCCGEKLSSPRAPVVRGVAEQGLLLLRETSNAAVNKICGCALGDTSHIGGANTNSPSPNIAMATHNHVRLRVPREVGGGLSEGN